MFNLINDKCDEGERCILYVVSESRWLVRTGNAGNAKITPEQQG